MELRVVLGELVLGLDAMLFTEASFELAQSLVGMLGGLVVDDKLIEILKLSLITWYDPSFCSHIQFRLIEHLLLHWRSQITQAWCLLGKVKSACVGLCWSRLTILLSYVQPLRSGWYVQLLHASL